MTALADIQNFLAQKRIAIVGVSRNPEDFSRKLFAEFVLRGYDAIAVNPNVSQVDGRTCFARLQDITPAPAAALLMTSHDLVENILKDCAEAGIKHVWIYGTNGRSKAPLLSISELRIAGAKVVDGECPFMFLNKSGGIHRFHGFFRRLFGNYPA
jgi:predicted CoA-binding protein